MAEFNQNIQDPVPEDEHSSSTGDGRYVFPDLAEKVLGCIGGGPKGVSGEGGVKYIGMDIRPKEFPPQNIILGIKRDVWPWSVFMASTRISRVAG